jgi:hypothetical protein
LKRVGTILAILAAGIIALLLLRNAAPVVTQIRVSLRSQLMQYMASRLPADVRQAIRQEALHGANLWDAVPNPDVGQLGQRNRTVAQTGMEVHLNNAGMRASSPYVAKPDSVFRIVCLGDSFVFGMGAREEDRFCDQLEAFYRSHHIRVNGRPIETYALGLPGWTLSQEASYLAPRISSFDPDLVIVLAIPNDITDNFGITGMGSLTSAYSPEHRDWGSSVFSAEINSRYGDVTWAGRSALMWDLSPASRQRWDKAMQGLKRLADLQTERGKKILVSTLVWGLRIHGPDAFGALFQFRFAQAGMTAPFALIGFPVAPKAILKYDSHPSRAGHKVIADQYLHILDRLGWIAPPSGVLPHLSHTLARLNNLPPDLAPYQRLRTTLLTAFRDTIDFTRLRPAEARAFLGGLFPESWNPSQAVSSPTWASTRAAFLLRRPSDRPLKGVTVRFDIPPRPELFPFRITMLLDGAPAATASFAHANGTGHYEISGAATAPPFDDQVVEVMLVTSSFFSTIDDPRMKSYRPLRASAF